MPPWDSYASVRLSRILLWSEILFSPSLQEGTDGWKNVLMLLHTWKWCCLFKQRKNESSKALRFGCRASARKGMHIPRAQTMSLVLSLPFFSFHPHLLLAPSPCYPLPRSKHCAETGLAQTRYALGGEREWKCKERGGLRNHSAIERGLCCMVTIVKSKMRTPSPCESRYDPATARG